MAKRKRDQIVFLEDIVDCIDKIEAYMYGLSEIEFEKNSEKQDAVIRRIEIIGEAVKNISNEVKEKYPTIPWKEMAGMRDVLIHQYFGVTSGLIWRAATHELLIIKDQIRAIIDTDRMD